MKTYLAHCYELKTGEKTNVHWTMDEFAFAEEIARRGGLGIIENAGYFYDFETLKRTIEKMVGDGTMKYWTDRLKKS